MFLLWPQRALFWVFALACHPSKLTSPCVTILLLCHRNVEEGSWSFRVHTRDTRLMIRQEAVVIQPCRFAVASEACMWRQAFGSCIASKWPNYSTTSLVRGYEVACAGLVFPYLVTHLEASRHRVTSATAKERSSVSATGHPQLLRTPQLERKEKAKKDIAISKLGHSRTSTLIT